MSPSLPHHFDSFLLGRARYEVLVDIVLICSYDERVLPSIGNEVLKATVAQFDGEPIIYQRIKLFHLESTADEQLLSSLQIERLYQLESGTIS